MITLNTIVSSAQNHVGDIDGTRVAEGEWVDMVRFAMLEIGRKTHGYVRRAVIVPVPTIASPIVNTAEIPAATSPYLLTRVARILDGEMAVDCEEVSSQAVLNTQQTDSTFEINRTFFRDTSFSTKLQSTLDAADNTITLIFSKEFAVGEEVVVDYIGLRPFTWDLWNLRITPQIAVPDWYEAAIRYKLYYQAFELLFNRGDKTYYGPMQTAQMQYDKHMIELASYSRLLRNKGDIMRIRPINWLEE